MADTSDAPAPTVSYAKIVDPAKENGAKTVPAPEQSPPDQEQVIKKTVVSEDDEGFQPVTDKKKEKQKEKELLREKEYRKTGRGENPESPSLRKRTERSIVRGRMIRKTIMRNQIPRSPPPLSPSRLRLIKSSCPPPCPKTTHGKSLAVTKVI